MAGCVDGTERVIVSRKGGAIANFLVGHRNTLPAEGIDWDTEQFFQGKRPTDMVRMSMGDDYNVDTATWRALLYEGVEIGGIVNRWIDTYYKVATTAKDNSIGTWSRHHRRVGGQNDGIRDLHCVSPCCTSHLAHLRACHIFRNVPFVIVIAREVDACTPGSLFQDRDAGGYMLHRSSFQG